MKAKRKYKCVQVVRKRFDMMAVDRNPVFYTQVEQKVHRKIKLFEKVVLKELKLERRLENVLYQEIGTTKSKPSPFISFH